MDVQYTEENLQETLNDLPHTTPIRQTFQICALSIIHLNGVLQDICKATAECP